MSTMETNAAARPAIETCNQQFMETFRRGDAAGLAALYTEDGQALPPNSRLAAGRQAIQQVWQGAFDAGLTEARLESVEVEGHGDTAIEIGRYTLFAGEHQTADEGKYIVIWRRQGGTWLLHRDIWNSSRPAA